jgi:hypothetical protein
MWIKRLFGFKNEAAPVVVRSTDREKVTTAAKPAVLEQEAQASTSKSSEFFMPFLIGLFAGEIMSDMTRSESIKNDNSLSSFNSIDSNSQFQDSSSLGDYGSSSFDSNDYGSSSQDW